MRPCLITALALAVPLLSSCTGEIMQSHINRVGVPSYFTFAAGPGEMRTVVLGNPFAVSKELTGQAVTDAMQGNHAGPRTRFTTMPGPAARASHRIVVLFNPARSFSRYDLCDDPAALRSGPTVGERLVALVGYCVGDYLFSDAKISIPAVATPLDPRFANMISSAMWELVPSRDPFDMDDDCRVPICQ
ncbi:MAG: hypothetical protein HN403_02205 [Rhodospirillales bacterium]|nr:hypothetical protein [Rhodospirillales bacterium]